jgi:hypothetical protein
MAEMQFVSLEEEENPFMMKFPLKTRKKAHVKPDCFMGARLMERESVE